MTTTKHTIIALVEDKPGVLNRMASLFRRRGFNIERVEQVRKQLEKIVDVVKVSDISGDNIIARQLALIKVKATSSTRSEIIEIVDIFRASIVDVASDSVTIEATGDEDKINSLLGLLRGFGIKEITRTGRVAMTRGSPGSLPVKEGLSKMVRDKGQKTS